MLTAQDHNKIAAAVAKAEAATAGEILCVLAQQVSNYRETPLAWGAGCALLAPPIAFALGLQPYLLSREAAWAASGPDALNAVVRSVLGGYALAQVLIFVLVATAVAVWWPLKLMLTPKALKHRRVHQAAMAQLLATRLLGSSIGAAVVIFASISDRIVVVVADEAIHQKVGDAAWDKAVAAVLNGVKSGAPAEGFIEAVGLCGALLAEHFPADGPARNHLADGLLEL